MPLTPAAIAAAAGLAAGAAIRGAQVGALDEGPEYIKSGDPESPIDAIGLFAARQACKLYADDPDRLNDRPAASYERVCRPFLDNIGYGTGPSVRKPFDGGQCAVSYRVDYTATSWASNGEVVFSGPDFGFFLGPIGGLSFGSGCVANPVGPLASGAKGFCCFISTGSGQQVLLGNGNGGVSASIISVTRADGQSDDCGDPPPIIDEPVPPPTPEPPKRPFTFAPNFDIDVEVGVDIDGRISIDIGTGPIVVDPFGDGDDGDGGGDGGPDDSPPSPEPGPEQPGGNGGFGGDDLFGLPPAGRRWVGCCITIVNRPPTSGVITNTPPEDVYPAVVGNIRLVCDAAGNRVTDTPVRINAKKVCVWEPVRKLNPVGVSVDLLPGYGYTYRPYSVPLEV